MPSYAFRDRDADIQEVAGMFGRHNVGNYFALDVPFTSATWNTVAAHETHTVTGAVRMLILPEVKTLLVGATATLVFGDETTTNSLIASTVASDLAAGEWWFDATATRTLAAKAIFDKMDFVVANGKDLGFTIGTAALTAGALRFHTWWIPLDSTGLVVPGAGGVL